MKVHLHTDNDAFDQLREQWQHLQDNSVTRTPFNTWAWNKEWWAAYHPGDLWILHIEDEGEVKGIAPFFIDSNRMLRFIGHIDVVDYLDLLAVPSRADEVYAAIAAYLKENCSAFDAIGVANIEVDSPTKEGLANALRDCGFTVEFEQNDVAPRIELPDDYETYLSDILDSRERKETKRKMRKAEGGLYDMAWYIVDDSHDLNEQLDLFLDLMRSADAEKAEFLENEQNVDFFKRIMPHMAEGGWLQLMFLTIDDTPSAAYLSFDYNDKIWVYNSGLEPQQFGALSPGIVLLQYAIQHAIEHSKTVFDFLRGDENYKHKMGGRDTTIHQINATIDC